jgi:HPt (histidine-containing phosphotransfer) domain-containing protein
MTAHAMAGARDECIKHGMDSYLSKPIDKEALWRVLDALNQPITQNIFTSSSTSSNSTTIVDFGKVREALDNDQTLFNEVVRLFLRDAPNHLEMIKTALVSNDFNAMRHSAHAIKGMVGTFAAERTLNAAEFIELNAGKTDLNDTVNELEVALFELESAISNYQWD